MKTWNAKKPKTVKTRKRLNKKQKIPEVPKIHIRQRHQTTEKNPEKTKLATNLKKIRKTKKT